MTNTEQKCGIAGQVLVGQFDVAFECGHRDFVDVYAKPDQAECVKQQTDWTYRGYQVGGKCKCCNGA